eukprot:TRINITY_DN18488_c0_g1_i2.p1 TRINITY_DN18488_c0_g1~~TRINITY_DN18488_c0_g1_i2.p1  ORF type:complete len:202 (+),score=31.75 TRINITY_DN18488_c0_g1_i2:224-829(+)
MYLVTSNKAPMWVGEFGANTKVNNTWWNYSLRYFKDLDLNWCYWPVDAEKLPRNFGEKGRDPGYNHGEGLLDTYGIFDSSRRDYSAVVGWKLQQLIDIQPPSPNSPLELPVQGTCVFDLEANLEAASRQSSMTEWLRTVNPQNTTMAMALVFSDALIVLFGCCCCCCCVGCCINAFRKRLYGNAAFPGSEETQPLAASPSP